MKGKIYFIVCRSLNAVKIGFTTGQPHVRLSSFQTGCPATLELWGSVPGTMDEEKALHRAFAALHIQGEWFSLIGKLKDFVCYIGTTEERDVLTGALFDVLYGGIWHPSDPMSEAEYDATGTHRPLQHLIAHAIQNVELSH